MTLLQEAIALMQDQPECNLRRIIRMLHEMNSEAAPRTDAEPFKRTGAARGRLNLPAGFDEHFDDLNGEIADLFCGDAV